jgi:hypothetical protein
MHAVVRTYSGHGAKQLFNLLEQKKAEVEAAPRKVKGFASYTLLKAGDGGVSITVCHDKAGTDESVTVSRDWILKNGPQLSAAPPVVLEGPVILNVK